MLNNTAYVKNVCQIMQRLNVWKCILNKGPFTHVTNEKLKPTNQCDILDCVYFIMTFAHNEPVLLVSMTNKYLLICI